MLSIFERDTLNFSQILQFARTFGLVLECWRLNIIRPEDTWCTPEELGAIYGNELATLWGYFVEGAPALLIEGFISVRGLVKGTPGLLDSLSFTDNRVP